MESIEPKTNADDKIRELLQYFGISANESSIEQMRVYIQAMMIFDERNVKYEDLWTEGGWRDSLHHILHKSARIKRMFYRTLTVKPDEDDVIDLMNYCVFFLRNLRHGSEWGK